MSYIWIALEKSNKLVNKGGLGTFVPKLPIGIPIQNLRMSEANV
jgi:hypothetical protein